MRIAYLAKTQVPGQAANSVQSINVCSALSALGHQVTFFVIDEGGRKDKLTWHQISDYYGPLQKFDIARIPTPKIKNSRLRYLWSSAMSAFYIKRELSRKRFDIVYSRNVLAAAIACYSRLDTVFEAHAPVWFGILESVFFRYLVRSRYLLKLVAITKSLERSYALKYPALGHRTMIAPDGAEIAVRGKCDESMGGLWGEPNRLKIGYVGSLYKGKGLEVIEAIAPSLPNVEFHIIGGRPEDVKEWKTRIQSKNVFFYGFLSRARLGAYYNYLDICLLPNQEVVWGSGSDCAREPLNIGPFTSPLKMFEYMAYGKAIIASDLPVLREVLHEGIATLVPPKDFEKWREAIKFFSDSDRRYQYGQAAQKELRDRYTWSARMRKIIQEVSPGAEGRI